MIALLVPMAVSSLVARCAPGVGPVTMSALVAYESSYRALAIGDNTTHRSYFPPNARAANGLAIRLLRDGDSIDVGYAQINSANFARFHLTARSAFEPCTNLATGAAILREAYRGAASRFGYGQIALVHALSAYNSGGYFAGLAYARSVYDVAATLRFRTIGGFGVDRTRRAVAFVPKLRAEKLR